MIKRKIRKVTSLILIFSLILTQLFSVFTPLAYATSSPWAQTNWSGGSGQTNWSDTTKFSSSSNVTASSSNVTLANTEKLSNTGFNSDASSWSVAAVPPSGWIEVPGNSTFSTTNFLIMKYEAKCAATSDLTTGLTTGSDTYSDFSTACTSANNRAVVSVASGNPVVRINQIDSDTRCSAVSLNSTTAHLQKNNEWMTIARDAEAQNANWNSGTAGDTNSYMFSGNNDGNPNNSLVASADDTLGYVNTGNSSGNQKRTLTLSNGSVIWDLSGNVSEWTNDTQDSAGTIDAIQSFVEWSSSNIATGARALFGPSSASYISNQGMGKVYGGQTSNGFLRGGDWGGDEPATGGINAGAFALNLSYAPGLPRNGIGFRCASDPVAISQSFSSSSGRSSGGGNTVAIGSVTDGKLYQSINVGDTSTYNISAYAYNNTAGSVGGTVDTNVAQLYYGGNAISNAIWTPVNGETGWYKLTGTVTGVASSVNTGVLVKSGKTVIVDDMSLSGGYPSSGTLTSSVFDSAQESNWGPISSTTTTPTNTSVSVTAAFSDDSSNMGSFAACTTSSCATNKRYAQYKITLSTTDTTVTPTFSSFSLPYSPYDNIAPTTSDDVDSSWHSGSVTVTLTCADNAGGSGCATTYYTTDGSTPSVSSSSGTSFTLSSNGTYTIKYFSKDVAGNIESVETATNQVKIDTTSPSVPGTPTYSLSSANSTKPTWTWTASTDSGSGLSTTIPYTVEWCSNSSFTGCSSNTTTTTTASYTHTTALTDGTWYFEVKATDVTGNVSAFSASGSVVIDTTAPNSFSLVTPDDSTYTNNSRPTFKWNTASIPDATSGLSKYTLSVNNGGDGNFSVDTSTTGTSDVVKDTYVIHFDGFNDSDLTNNYISVYTRSSSLWSSSQNDGKLKEGKRTWTVTATDNAGNTIGSSRTIYADYTNPAVSKVALTDSDILGTKDTYTVVSSLKPTITGDISDNQSPDKVELSFSKQNFFLGIETGRTLFVLETFDLKNTSNKTSMSFSFAPSHQIDYGKYMVDVVGIDKAGNRSLASSFNLWVLSDDKAKLILTEGKTKEEKEKLMEEIRNKSQISLPAFEKKALLRRQKEAGEFDKLFKETQNQFVFFGKSGGNSLAVVWNTVRDLALAITTAVNGTKFLGIGSFIQSSEQMLANVNTQLTNSQIETGKQIAKANQGASEKLSASGQAIALAWHAFLDPAEKTTNILGRMVIGTRVAISTFQAYVFDNNPTRITDVAIEKVDRDYIIISWQTNHYTNNNKVNYGKDLSYGQNAFGSNWEKNHQVKISNLKPGQKYYFEVMSQNKNYAYDAYYSFTTKN